MGKNVPDAPDYVGAAEATAQSNRQMLDAQTAANRPNQITPFGNQTWSQQQQFDQAGYDRALADWQSQYGPQTNDRSLIDRWRSGSGMSDDARMAMPSRNDYTNTNWTQTTTLDPELQGALDSQIDLQRGRSDLANSMFPRAQEEFGKPMDWGGFNPMQTGPQAGTYGEGLNPFSFGPGANQYNAESIQRDIGAPQDYVQRAEDAIMGRFNNRMEPQFQRSAEQLDVRLRNQGLKPGDQAYDQQTQDLRNSQNDAREQAMYQSIIGSGAEGQRLLGMDLSAGGFRNDASQQALQQQLAIGGQRFSEGASAADRNNSIRQQMLQQQLAAGGQQFSEGQAATNMNNTVRQQQIAEEMQRRGFSLNEINAIITGQQVGMPSMPGFSNAGRAPGTDYSGAASAGYGAALDATNAQNAGIGNLFGGLTQLGVGAMAFSDRRLKTDVHRTGDTVRGVPVYRYRYLWDTPETFRLGVMADECQHLPGVVVQHESGYLMVNYGRLYS